jgi:hypothetical protein
METSQSHTRRKTGHIIVCAICNTPFKGYRRDKKTCSIRCRKQLKERHIQLAASEKLMSEIIGLYKTYQSEQATQTNKIIY